MAMQRARRFDVPFDEMLRVQITGMWSVDLGGNGKPSDGGGSCDASAQGEQKAA